MLDYLARVRNTRLPNQWQFATVVCLRWKTEITSRRTMSLDACECKSEARRLFWPHEHIGTITFVHEFFALVDVDGIRKWWSLDLASASLQPHRTIMLFELRDFSIHTTK